MPSRLPGRPRRRRLSHPRHPWRASPSRDRTCSRCGSGSASRGAAVSVPATAAIAARTAPLLREKRSSITITRPFRVRVTQPARGHAPLGVQARTIEPVGGPLHTGSAPAGRRISLRRCSDSPQSRPSGVTCLWMTTARIRAVLAATAATALVAHGLSGHGLPRMTDEMAGATAGLCLLLATAVACVAAPRPEAHEPVAVGDAGLADLAATPGPPVDGRARASPSTLQRFRN